MELGKLSVSKKLFIQESPGALPSHPKPFTYIISLNSSTTLGGGGEEDRLKSKLPNETGAAV